MAADWSIGEADEHARVLLSQRFDPSRLSLVAEGRTQAGTWELHDGLHPRIEDPGAVGERVIIRNRRHGDKSETCSVGSALSPGQTAVVGTAGDVLMARCASSVASADIAFDDGTRSNVRAVTSTSTGQHWIVLAFETEHRPTHVSFLDVDGNLLDAQSIAPRPQRRRPV